MAEGFFTWGQGGRKMTPDQLAAERAALAVMQAREGDTSPVAHWSQGLGRVVNALAGNYRESKADKAEAAGIAQGQAAMDPVLRALMGGGSGAQGSGYSGGAASIPTWSPTPQAPSLTADVTAPASSLGFGSATPAMPAEGSGGLAFGDMQPKLGSGPITGEAIVNGLVQRGMPPHVAQGFAMNFADESAFNPNAVGDNGNAFGLAQWNGPRMASLQNYAAQAGTPASDPNTQLDYLMTELQGPEAGAMARIAATDTPQAAAQAVLNNFERPAEAHRARREASYAGGQMPGQSYAGGGNPITMSTQGQPQGDILSLLMAAQADPWAAKQYGPVINALMGSELTNRQNAQDPMYQLGLQKAQMEVDAMRNPAAPAPIEVNGQLIDPRTGAVMGDYRTADVADPFAGTKLVGDQLIAPNGQGGFAPVYSPPANPEAPTTKQVKLSDGSEVMVQWNPQKQTWDAAPIPQGGTPGIPPKKLTEAQAKITLFKTLQDKTSPVLTDLETQFDPANLSDPTLAKIPIAGNYFTSPDYQMYKAAASAWAEGALRISTGAAATEPEIQRLLATYFAVPGDTPETVSFKAQLRNMYGGAVNNALGSTDSGVELPLPSEFAKQATGADIPDDLTPAEKAMLGLE